MPHPAAPHRRKLIVAAAAMLAAALVLTGCATAPSHEPASPSTNSRAVDTGFLADHDLDGLDAAQVIERLDTMPVADRPTDLIASVQPDALVLTDDQKRETRLPMPEDEVYISVAPYREQTHDCYFHSLTTCLGELANTAVQVTLTGEDGDVLLDEVRQTYDNGFVGIWVPRGIKATLTIEHEGRTGTVTISTMNEDDATCITTLQLT
ncbi:MULTISPECIES: CueP family metal-binding protein [unclassified Microbacterium]|uniref:CueP family metal-binding protein n=1 Tax=unclassified Microbacterium TaxID=2609290 RepID=UPI002468849E|nr:MULTISPECIES: CueP family metal-binding protein [unclassified Microbacterium]MDH5134305.1 CueP family metal-binding protein [Microbacterium sp. RD10]MDH5137688.1 CueP family metal-binding protein [Microbacterium sp. RD11]MDH5145494.1 CueP family metal-binding protein [Microbacterium sp. RD12]MDH5155758.1 CueP family metal-binding protein [Microbacterium sp. RD06]MDH5166425.1 CueP family metal-binding protein [Microbacterium sp. RD02]